MFSFRFSVLVWLALATSVVAKPAHDPQVRQWIHENLDSVVDLYEHLHRNPELSFEEKETAKRLAQELSQAGFDVTQNVGGLGVVGILENGSGPTVMLRADLDALPVAEQTGLPYASQATAKTPRGTVRVMHACGHDLHMANLIGTSRYLANHRDQWKGTLVCIGQPAEERGAGAKAMLEDGLFQRFPRPDFALALHVTPVVPTGKISYRAGYAMANVDSVDITIHGRGGHGAYPHTTLDPIVIAARLVLDLQTIVSREVKPIDPAVVTVGSIRAGTKHNIIPDDCHLQLTVRSYRPEVRAQLHAAIKRKAEAAAAAVDAPSPTVEISEGTPSLYNAPELVQRVLPAMKKELGDDALSEGEPVMGGEDFSRYGLAGVPIFMFALGAIEQDRLTKYAQDDGQPPSLHSPLFYPDARPALKTGIRAMVAAVKELMPPSE